ncbi:hypothetical protein ACOMHN_058016 [Nucella lapillus]
MASSSSEETGFQGPITRQMGKRVETHGATSTYTTTTVTIARTTGGIPSTVSISSAGESRNGVPPRRYDPAHSAFEQRVSGGSRRGAVTPGTGTFGLNTPTSIQGSADTPASGFARATSMRGSSPAPGDLAAVLLIMEERRKEEKRDEEERRKEEKREEEERREKERKEERLFLFELERRKEEKRVEEERRKEEKRAEEERRKEERLYEIEMRRLEFDQKRDEEMQKLLGSISASPQPRTHSPRRRPAVPSPPLPHFRENEDIDVFLEHFETMAARYEMDDVLVTSETWEAHLLSLHRLFQRLHEVSMSARPSKCQLGLTEVEFLGHSVGCGQMTTQEDKERKIRDAEPPKTKKELRAFLGLVGYYRRFVPHFSDIALPLTQKTRGKQPQKIVWSDECQEAFDKLKQALVSHPVLILPDHGQQFVLRTDASGQGLGAVLLQEREGILQPVSYASKKLSDAEKRYHTIEQECLAVVWGIRKFYPYLYGREFILESDHNPLMYLHRIRPYVLPSFFFFFLDRFFRFVFVVFSSSFDDV